MNTLGVLGSGAWGTALATLLTHNGHTVHLWCHEQDVFDDIARHGINKRYLPGIHVGPLVLPTTDVADVCMNASVIFEAVPVPHMRAVMSSLRSFVRPDHHFVVASKGIERGTLFLPLDVINDVVGSAAAGAVVSGPSFAKEVALKRATVLVVASTDHAWARELASIIKTPYCHAVCSDDPIGVQCAGALKNVIALGMGILDGNHCADNTKAFVLSQGLAEIARCSQALGGTKEAIYGPAGFGDLVLTAMGSLSRNVYLGRCFACGTSLEDVVRELGTVPEGVNTARAAFELVERYAIEAPVLCGVHRMIEGTMRLEDFLATLLQN